MEPEQPKREQKRLMSDDSHSGEYGNDIIALYRDYDNNSGCWSRMMRSKTAKLAVMLSLILGYFFAELVVGHITNSLTLIADSFHMLSDALSLVVALVAVRMSKRTATDPFRPWPSKEPYFNTFGWVRFEVLGALINSTFLLALCMSIVLEAVEKFTSPEPVDNPQLVLAVGGGGLAINIFGLIIFGSHAHGHHHHDHSNKSNNSNHENASGSTHEKQVSEEHLNMKAVFLHVLGDALGSVIVMISATVLWQLPISEDKNRWTLYLDPAMSTLLVCIMVCTTVPLFKQSSMILLQTVPKRINLEKIREKLRKISGIQAIHDLHIWQLTGERIVASVHVQCADAETYLTIVQGVKVALHDEGIHSCTVQPEFTFSDSEQSPFCQLLCGESCAKMTCCPPDNGNKVTQTIGHTGCPELQDFGRQSEFVSEHEISVTVEPCCSTSIASVVELKQNAVLSDSQSVPGDGNEVVISTNFSEQQVALNSTQEV